MAVSLLCCWWWFHVSARKGLWQISAVPGTGVELWGRPCLGAMEVKWQSIDRGDGRLKRSVIGQGHAPFPQPLWPTPTAKQDSHTHFYILYVHTDECIQKPKPQTHTQKLHYEELLVSNHPRLFPIIISFNNNHIQWKDETLHDDT